MAPVACPKCSVVVFETASGGWRFDPPTGCVDLQDTEWGAKGEFEWCPTLAVAMPDEVFWPGQSHRESRDAGRRASARWSKRESGVFKKRFRDLATKNFHSSMRLTKRGPLPPLATGVHSAHASVWKKTHV
jgi:hypothetical protein